MAELVDALASGASARKGVEVRVFSWAPYYDFGSAPPRANARHFSAIVQALEHLRAGGETKISVGTPVKIVGARKFMGKRQE